MGVGSLNVNLGSVTLFLGRNLGFEPSLACPLVPSQVLTGQELPKLTVAKNKAAELLGAEKASDLEILACLPAGKVDSLAVERLASWLDQGRAGEMGWLENQREVLPDLRAWKPWAKSFLMIALPSSRPAGGFREGGRVARYALGKDYHHVMRRRLEKLGRHLQRKGCIERARAVVDAAPVLEREWALQGMLGFRGKNTLVIHPHFGPWLLLGGLLVDQELPTFTAAKQTPECGTCNRCVQACPTGALDADYQLDARRCISYLTIEHRSAIPLEMRPLLGDHVFGCDLCLEACPFGDKAKDQQELWGTLPVLQEWRLEDLVVCSEDQFQKKFSGSPIRRAGWECMVRNACVVLGNLNRGEKVLQQTLQHPSALVREHAAWALDQIQAQ